MSNFNINLKNAQNCAIGDGVHVAMNDIIVNNHHISHQNQEFYGKTAFEAYKVSKQGTTYDAKPIPEWADLGDDVRNAWIAAAIAVIVEYA